jgi:Family of unknown function (DUF6503)
MKYLMVIFLSGVFLSCVSEDGSEPTLNPEAQTQEVSKSDSLINQTIEAHGGELYDQANYQFTFREKKYVFKNDGANYSYTSEYQSDEGWQKDILENGDFMRFIDGEKLSLSEEDAGKYGESLNSVVYFATLPHKLSDASVKSNYIGVVEIDSVSYESVKVTFSQEGGGEDFEDEYFYWINQQTKLVDYFAYNYKVNGGGVRFRVPYNQRVVEGITFQDYINYSAEVGTPLKDLPNLFELDSLQEVSRVELVDIKSLNKP